MPRGITLARKRKIAIHVFGYFPCCNYHQNSVGGLPLVSIALQCCRSRFQQNMWCEKWINIHPTRRTVIDIFNTSPHMLCAHAWLRLHLWVEFLSFNTEDVLLHGQIKWVFNQLTTDSPYTRTTRTLQVMNDVTAELLHFHY